MRRRALLAALAAGTAVPAAGCLGDETNGDDDSDDRTDDPGGPSPIGAGEWPHYRYDPGNTGYGPSAGPIDGARVNWWSETCGVNTGPVVADGMVYVGSGLRNWAVSAFDVESGDREWETPVRDDIERAMAVQDGTVYVSAGDAYAFDAATGDEEWSEPVNSVRGITVGEDAVFTASDRSSETVALEADSGEERWRRDVHMLDAPAVSDGLVYVTGSRGLTALDAESGETEWFEEVDRGRRSPTAVDGMVYVPTRSELVALDAVTGEEEWTVEGNFGASEVAVVEDTLYLAGRQPESDGAVSRALAVDTDDGNVRWTQDDPGLGGGNVIAGEDAIYLTTRYRLYALDPADGDVRWWLRFEWPIDTPALVDGGLFLPVGGRLFAIATGDGRDGIWETDAEPLPDRSATAPEPAYAGSDFAFGMGGYEVEHETAVTVDDGAPFDVSLDVAGSRIDEEEQVTITLAVQNHGETSLNFLTGAPTPFGILTMTSDDNHIAAWTEAYEESGHVHTAPHRGITGVNDIGLSTEVPAGETVSETYTVSDGSHGIRPGTYEFTQSFTLRPEDAGTDEGWAFEASGTVKLTETGTDPGSVVRDLAVADRVSLPEEFMGEFSVEVLEPIAEHHPGLIEVALKNATDERSLIASMRDWPFGSYVGLGPDGKRLVLLPAETYAPALVDHADDGGWEPQFLPHESIVRGRGVTGMDAGEVESRRFIVTTHPETNPPEYGDTYAFEQGYGDDDVDVSWGFALSVLDPGE